MPTIKLTKRAIAALPAPDPSGKQVLYWDEELKGLAVLCSGVTSSKTFIIQRAVRGKSRRVTLGAVAEYKGKSIEDVRRAAGPVLLDLRAGRDPKAEDEDEDKDAIVTLSQALDRYLEARPNLAASSRTGYRYLIERHFPRWLDTPLREITPEMIEARYRAIKDEVAARRAPTVAGRDTFIAEPGTGTANGALRALRLLWNFSVARAPDIPSWPPERLRGQWYRSPRREQHVAAGDLRKFYEAANALDEHGDYVLGRGLRDVVILTLFTGLRRREATGLRWASVDLAAAIIRLSAKSTKAKRPLDLPISDVVYDLLVARRALGVDGPFVFPGVGRSGCLQEPKRAFTVIARLCGVAVSPHALRATFITIAADCPISAFALRGLVNHSVGDDVTSGYVMMSVEALREPAQLVADKLKRYCGIAPEEAENVRPLRPKG